MNLADKIVATFNNLNVTTVDSLDDLYAHNMIFEDPAHKIIGLDNFKSYCQQLYTNTDSCKFIFLKIQEVDNIIFLEWEMHLVHPKLNKGKTIIVPGISRVNFAADKIVAHRDYFDMGKMLYENLPLLGKIIRHIKRKLGQ